MFGASGGRLWAVVEDNKMVGVRGIARVVVKGSLVVGVARCDWETLVVGGCGGAYVWLLGHSVVLDAWACHERLSHPVGCCLVHGR